MPCSEILRRRIESRAVRRISLQYELSYNRIHNYGQSLMCEEEELVRGFAEEGNREEDEETQSRPALLIARHRYRGYYDLGAYDGSIKIIWRAQR
jgi:hypothetical protein